MQRDQFIKLFAKRLFEEVFPDAEYDKMHSIHPAWEKKAEAHWNAAVVQTFKERDGGLRS